MRCCGGLLTIAFGLLSSGLVLSSLSTSAAPRWKVLAGAKDVQAEYDYVIIGGGTAGLTVADRLTADGKATVLVIEHGEIGKFPILHQVKYTGLRLASELVPHIFGARRLAGIQPAVSLQHPFSPAG